ncbi:hypothetical protein TWF281_008063 [Arthrobotrys megalospora]
MLIFGSIWIIIGSLWVIYWPRQVAFKPVIKYLPTLFGDPAAGSDSSDPLHKPDDHSQDAGRGVRGGSILPAIAKAAGKIKDTISFESIPDDEKRRPWKYPHRHSRKQIGTEKATLLMLARNNDLYAVRESMRRLEDRFNHRFRYPWTFMNDKPFTEEFINITTNIASGTTEYLQVPKEHWGYPDWVNQTLAKQNMKEMERNNVIYGGSLSYRRVEPGVNFYCDQHYDPFKWLRENGKSYGFTVVLHDFRETIASLWETTEKFFSENPQYVHPNGMRPFLLQNETRNGKPYEDYNTCHFWTNFEIGKTSLWKSEKYMKYFEYLDATGNFFYERWGDAPVHSVALAHMWDKKEIHFFNDIGYEHSPFRRCPKLKAQSHGVQGRCLCPLDISLVDESGFSCFDQWKKTYGDDYEVDLTW